MAELLASLLISPLPNAYKTQERWAASGVLSPFHEHKGKVEKEWRRMRGDSHGT